MRWTSQNSKIKFELFLCHPFKSFKMIPSESEFRWKSYKKLNLLNIV